MANRRNYTSKKKVSRAKVKRSKNSKLKGQQTKTRYGAFEQF